MLQWDLTRAPLSGKGHGLDDPLPCHFQINRFVTEVTSQDTLSIYNPFHKVADKSLRYLGGADRLPWSRHFIRNAILNNPGTPTHDHSSNTLSAARGVVECSGSQGTTRRMSVLCSYHTVYVHFFVVSTVVTLSRSTGARPKDGPG